MSVSLTYLAELPYPLQVLAKLGDGARDKILMQLGEQDRQLVHALYATGLAAAGRLGERKVVLAALADRLSRSLVYGARNGEFRRMMTGTEAAILRHFVEDVQMSAQADANMRRTMERAQANSATKARARLNQLLIRRP